MDYANVLNISYQFNTFFSILENDRKTLLNLFKVNLKNVKNRLKMYITDLKKNLWG